MSVRGKFFFHPRRSRFSHFGQRHSKCGICPKVFYMLLRCHEAGEGTITNPTSLWRGEIVCDYLNSLYNLFIGDIFFQHSCMLKGVYRGDSSVFLFFYSVLEFSKKNF